MGNNINFDDRRYIALLKKDELLKDEGTCLINENRNEGLELLSYNIVLQDQIYYNQRAVYISLIEQYLRESSNSGEDGGRLFVWEFFTIFKNDNNIFKILKKEILQHGIQKLVTVRSQIDSKSTEFSILVNHIAGYCEFLTFDPEDSDGMTLDQFRDSIQKIYLEIQNNNQE